MTFEVINLFGEDEPDKKPPKKEAKLEPRIDRLPDLQKQVINIKGEIVTV